MSDASTLDAAKFRKVHALMEGGSTKGERDAARAQAGKIAARAGLTIEQAMSKLDTAAPTKPANFFEGFDDWMEEREPGYKARRGAEKDDREAAKARLRSELIDRHGSEEAVFNHTQEEEALAHSVAHLAAWSSFTDQLGMERRCVSKLDGVRLDYPAFDKLTPAVSEAVAAAYPLQDLSGVLAEYHKWNTLRTNREAFLDGEWIHNMEVTARISVLEHELDTRPAATWHDMHARMAWWQEAINSDFKEERERQQARHDRIAADLSHLRESSGQVVHLNRRTNIDKRSAVLSMLGKHTDLSDREISRRCGVSPQTVSTWRKRCQTLKR